MGERRGTQRVLVGRPRLYEMVILKWIFRKLDGEAWAGWIWLRIGTGGGGCCECGNEPSFFHKMRVIY